MKNGCGENSETQILEQSERAKKLYRYVSEIARRIEDAAALCTSVPNLFNTSTEVQRQKLTDNCEKLMFIDPINYGKKTLELIWRKVYYDTVTAAKKLQNANDEYDQYLFTHIVCGIGQFHNLITRIQSEAKLQFKELDYIPVHKDDEHEKIDMTPEAQLEQWGRSAIHSCLIYLGDLSRYQVEIFHTFDPSIAARYYLQAAQVDLSSGMPYNQLGNLYMDKNHNLDSVYFYIHCLSCAVPFEGALGNLTKLFDKNAQVLETLPANVEHDICQTEHIQGTICRFLSLIDIWYTGKEDSEIPQRCNMIAQDLRVALDLEKLPLPDINKNYEEYTQAIEEEIINPSYLNTSLIHTIVQICIFTIAKISEIDDKKAFGAKAFSLATLSQLLQKLLQNLQKYGFKNPASKYYKRYNVAKEVQSEISEPPKEEEIVVEVPVVNGKHEEQTTDVKENVTTDNNNLENGDTKINNKKISAKRRRRRRMTSSESSADTDDTDSSDDTELSDTEEDDNTDSSYHTDSKSDISDIDQDDIEPVNTAIVNGNGNNTETLNNTLEKKSEIDTDIVEAVNNQPILPKKIETSKSNSVGLDATEIQNFLRGNNFLPSIKLLQDWILKEIDLILSCGESGESLFQCVVDLLNIFEFYFSFKHKNKKPESCKILDYAKSTIKSLELEYKKIPLPEDVNLRGTNVCKFDTNAAEWNILDQYKPSIYEENIIRILNFIDFGHQIAKIVPRIRYNRTMQIFYLKKNPTPKLTTKVNHKRSREWHNSKKPHVEGNEGGLLRRLGRLWLESQVRELERFGRAPSPTLLAMDASALNLHLRRVKQLMRTKTFIILIPTIVLQELDDLKREQITARDAIRWLETQLQGSSRFLRAQRPGQSRALPLLKYPRKAPSHIQNYIQILEFCYHFIAEEKPQGGNGDVDSNSKSAPMLIILTGNEPGTVEEHKEFSFSGAAQSAGISVEYIDHFYTKWRQSVHKSGKKR